MQSHLQFVQCIDSGGLGPATLSFHDSLKSIGCQSKVVTTSSQRFDDTEKGVYCYERLGPRFLYYSSRLDREAHTLVREADIVHGHGFYVGTNMVLGREAIRQGKPLVYHVHGFLTSLILNRSRWKKNLVHWLFEDKNFRHVGLWRALTAAEAEQIRQAGITAPIVVAPNGIDLSIVDQVEVRESKKDGRRRLLYLGRLHPTKGLDILLEAWAQARSFHDKWVLQIVGPSFNDYKEVLVNTLQSQGLAHTVEFVGEVLGNEKVDTLRNAEVFVLPSYSEGFSVAVLEALACSRPVLITEECNFPEVGEYEAGWLCQANAKSLSNALQQVLSADEMECRQRGLNGRHLVEQHYTCEIITRKIVAACDDAFKEYR